ncbi:repulsive guidance molecule A-like [Uloborus diversus]|uniref:repulsive guidance molecule A-like n=1 Tax=Uloborus diversus TaxID=327109 RepID=UPI002409488C|nr:repulsive guidance molecule A-like [Uloborus diversus]
MGRGCSGGPAETRRRNLLPLLASILLFFSSIPASSADCKVQLCSRQYARALEEDHVVQGSSFRYCSLLRSYADCVRATARSCRGDLVYHSVHAMVVQWTRMYECARILEKGPAPSPERGPGGGHRGRPSRPHGECASYRSAAYSHCALFGDPHLRTFYDELQTCSIPGAWPLLDNPHLAVQVTNEPVGKGSTATAITKVTVIVRQHGSCAQEKTYEAQVDSLPSVFVDGSKWSGPGVRIREETPGKHIEIHFRYIATRIIVRQVGRYLTFATRMPSAIAVQGAQSATLELCVKGCPKRERIDSERLLEPKSGPKREAIAACRALNITDFYLDACVFDLLTTGDGSFSAAAREAMLDAGQQPVVNGTLTVVPRSLESHAGAVTETVYLLFGMLLFLLYRYHHDSCR